MNTFQLRWKVLKTRATTLDFLNMCLLQKSHSQAFSAIRIFYVHSICLESKQDRMCKIICFTVQGCHSKNIKKEEIAHE